MHSHIVDEREPIDSEAYARESCHLDADITTWSDYVRLVERVSARFTGRFAQRTFDYVHPVRLQHCPVRFRKPYPVKVAYTHWGHPSQPTVICIGGVVNTAMRFSYLADALSTRYRVVCMDWLGRGHSGWLATEGDYSHSTYLEQLTQLIKHLRVKSVALLGSSLGGTVAIDFAATHRQVVDRVVLNDIGPFMSRSRRRRRAETLARHYVFRSPDELLRRIGASHKNDGPMSNEVKLFLAHHQTKWSDDENGRVYRHDIRAVQAYKQHAARDINQWSAWRRIPCRVLLIHGMTSDALAEETIRKMQRTTDMSVMHVPHTGHTPALTDSHQIELLHLWLDDAGPAGEWCSLPRSNGHREAVG